jgi:Txe/YoeB family toxin of Txe-Axe toxin-antitoxin module
MARLTGKRIGLLLAVLLLALVAALPLAAQDFSNSSEVAVAPLSLERISWGAIIAGTIVALMLQLMLNLLAVAVGASTLNPMSDDSATPGEVTQRTIISMAAIMLGALFTGGWVAARMAGTPEQFDGLLHGIVVWGLVILISSLLLSTAAGRLLSGVNQIIDRAMHALGSAASGLAGAAQSTAQVVGENLQRAGEKVADTAQQNRQQHPMGAPGGQNAFENIQREAVDILNRAGLRQGQVESKAREAVQDVRDAAMEAINKPEDLQRIVANTLGRVFNRGRELVSEVDRNEVVLMLQERGNMSREEAEETVRRWEEAVQQAPEKTGAALNEARARVEDTQRAVSSKVEQIQHDVEHGARQLAQSATDTIAKLAMAAFIIVLVGAASAGAGGYLGAPQEIPTAELPEEASVETAPMLDTAPVIEVTPTTGP